MNELLLILVGVATGAYFAEPIRERVPVLDPAKEKTTVTET